MILYASPASRVTGYLVNRSWSADHKAPGLTTHLPATECGVTHQCLVAGSDFHRLRARGPILTVPFLCWSAGKVTEQGGIFVSRVRLMGGGLDQKGLATVRERKQINKYTSRSVLWTAEHGAWSHPSLLNICIRLESALHLSFRGGDVANSSVCASGYYPVNSPLHCNAEGFWAGGSARCAPIH